MVQSTKNLFLPISRRREMRRGSAVVECALTAPLLIVLVLGSLDVGQLINAAQAVSNASRVGARAAIRQTATSTHQVKDEVEEYLSANGIPIGSATVKVIHENNTEIHGTELSLVPSGRIIRVKVEVQFAGIRRVSFLTLLNDAKNSSTSSMRRE